MANIDTSSQNGCKQLFIRSAGFGAGFAVLVCVAIAGILWWKSRPAQPKPWNNAAVTATFAGAEVHLDQPQLVSEYQYSVENHTGEDYELPPKTDLFKIAAAGNGLQHDDTLEWAGGTSIPSGQKMNISIRLKRDYDDSYPYKERDNVEKLNSFMQRREAETDGFAALDQVRRYRINFPKPPIAKK